MDECEKTATDLEDTFRLPEDDYICDDDDWRGSFNAYEQQRRTASEEDEDDEEEADIDYGKHDDEFVFRGTKRFTTGTVGHILDDHGDAAKDYDSEEVSSELILSDSDEDVKAQESQSVEDKLTWNQKISLVQARAKLDQANSFVGKFTRSVETLENELSECRRRMYGFEMERDDVNAKLQTASEQCNISSVNLLRGKFRKVCQELAVARKHEVLLTQELLLSKYELSRAEIKQTELRRGEQDLVKQEMRREQEARLEANTRLNMEAKNAAKMAKHLQRESSEASKRVVSLQQRHESYSAPVQHQAPNGHLKKHFGESKRLAEEEKVLQRIVMEKRLTSALQLKDSIATAKDHMKKTSLRAKATKQATIEADERWKKEIADKGQNAETAFLRRQRTEALDAKKKMLVNTQKARQVEIVAKLVAEEKDMKKRMKLNPRLYETAKDEAERIVKPHPKQIPQMLLSMQGGVPAPNERPIITEDDGYVLEDYGIDDDEEEEKEDDERKQVSQDTFSRATEGDDEDMSVPEFEGMWAKRDVKKKKITHVLGARFQGSKMEEDIMSHTMEQLHANVVRKQVTCGIEFKGQRPFSSKPDVIHFKVRQNVDFDVGKVYSKKVIMTNVTLTLNTCKLVGVSDSLKDFIELSFSPPGHISAGMTCELGVTFSPKLNIDLEGEVKFLAQTGPFAISVICTKKKCALKVDTELMDFGTSVIGETIHRTFTLSNSGALPTYFQIRKGEKKTEPVPSTASDVMSVRMDDGISGQCVESPGTFAASEVSGANVSRVARPDLGVTPSVSLSRLSEVDQPQPAAAENVTIQTKEPVQGAELTEGSAFDIYYSLTPADEITCQTTSGEINAFSSVSVQLVFKPVVTGKTNTFYILSFTDEDSTDILVNVTGRAVDIPVWIEKPEIDLKICQYDRLYQDTMIVHNTATVAQRVTFNAGRELRNHLEVLPKSGLIQAQSKSSFQLKFLPRKSLYEDAIKLFDKETGVLEAPLCLQVANVTLPIQFSVHAVVTTSEVTLDVTSIDFGHCTTYERTKVTVNLTNSGVLPQNFGFVGISDYLDVQPNDGFGVLLPRETLRVDCIFQPKKADVYNFDITCKTVIGGEIKLHCRGVGVHPPAELSYQFIRFPSTALNDHSTVSLHVINSHVNMDEFSHPLPRIGRGEPAPVGPTSFEFKVPEGVPISISPSVGTVLPGQKCRIDLRYSPDLTECEIKEEAARLLMEAAAKRIADELARKEELRQREVASAQILERSSKNLAAERASKSMSKRALVNSSQPSIMEQSVTSSGPMEGESLPQISADSILKGSLEYAAGLASLIKHFTGLIDSYTIPCYIASGSCSATLPQPNYSILNTLFVDVHCPSVKPQLVLLSEGGQTSLNFRDVALNKSVVKSITVQNITNKRIQLHSTCPNPAGPFEMVNALRAIEPDEIFNIKIRFTPLCTEMFQEVFKITSQQSTIYVTLKGVGINPVVNISVNDGLLDMGDIIIGDVKQEIIKLTNTSHVRVEYSLRLDSQSVHNQARLQISSVLDKTTCRQYVGTQNNSGLEVFDCVPTKGIIEPVILAITVVALMMPQRSTVNAIKEQVTDATTDITVTFRADRASNYFMDRCHVDLSGQDDAHVVILRGRCREHNMFITGGESLDAGVQSLSTTLPVNTTTENESSTVQEVPLLITLHSLMKYGELTSVTREISIRCIKTAGGVGKKGGDFSFENLNQLTPLGFTIDPPKGSVEIGTEKIVMITWKPPTTGFDYNKALLGSVNCILRGEVVETCKIYLQAFANSN